MSKNKVAIIGTGLGGLSAGALLAQDGYDVTIIEQHDRVGGCATVFQRGEFTCEVGLHEMDGLYSDPIKKKVFEKLGIYERLTFLRPKEFYRLKTDSIDFVMPHSFESACQKLVDTFPNDVDAIRKYFALIKKIANGFTRLTEPKWSDLLSLPFWIFPILRYKNSSVQTMMDTLFGSNEALKLILNANIGYYHDNSTELSFLMHAVAQYSYFDGGGWFIQGGSQRLSDTFADIIKQNGGAVLLKSDVTRIEPNKLFYKHKRKTKTLEFDILISNISPMQTYAMANIAYTPTKTFSPMSFFCIYLGFDTDLKTTYPNQAYSTFYLDDIDSLHSYNATADTALEKRGFVFVDYSQIDSRLAPQGKSFGVIVTSDYLHEWEDLDKQAYKEKKQRIKEVLIDRLEEKLPGIKQHIIYSEAATAKTTKRYIKTPNGTAYGFAPTVKQFFQPPQIRSKKMPHLFFVGQWVIGGGFSPTIDSGFLAYEAIKKARL